MIYLVCLQIDHLTADFPKLEIIYIHTYPMIMKIENIGF